MPIVFRVPEHQERRATLVLSDGSPILFARFEGEEKAFHIGCCWSAYLAGNRLNEQEHDMMSNVYSLEQNRSLAALRNVVSPTNVTVIPVTTEPLSVTLRRLEAREAALQAEVLSLLARKKEQETSISEKGTKISELEAQVARLRRDLGE